MKIRADLTREHLYPVCAHHWFAMINASIKSVSNLCAAYSWQSSSSRPCAEDTVCASECYDNAFKLHEEF